MLCGCGGVNQKSILWAENPALQHGLLRCNILRCNMVYCNAICCVASYSRDSHGWLSGGLYIVVIVIGGWGVSVQGCFQSVEGGVMKICQDS